MRWHVHCMASLVILAAACPVPAADADTEAAISKERKALEGAYQCVLDRKNGVNASDEDTAKVILTIDADGVIQLHKDGKTTAAATTQIDPVKSPKAINFTITEGEGKGKTKWGIYESDGETFRICYAEPGENRPTEFGSKSGSGCTLLAYQRVKK